MIWDYLVGGILLDFKACVAVKYYLSRLHSAVAVFTSKGLPVAIVLL